MLLPLLLSSREQVVADRPSAATLTPRSSHRCKQQQQRDTFIYSFRVHVARRETPPPHTHLHTHDTHTSKCALISEQSSLSPGRRTSAQKCAGLFADIHEQNNMRHASYAELISTRTPGVDSVVQPLVEVSNSRPTTRLAGIDTHRTDQTPRYYHSEKIARTSCHTYERAPRIRRHRASCVKYVGVDCAACVQVRACVNTPV